MSTEEALAIKNWKQKIFDNLKPLEKKFPHVAIDDFKWPDRLCLCIKSPKDKLLPQRWFHYDFWKADDVERRLLIGINPF